MEVPEKTDAILGGYEIPVKLEVFEGPLDLLLFLIKKNEIDIYDIPIERITKQYMEVIRSMESLSLEVAGEFFVMAASLMYIKSRMLLPVDERASSGDEPTEEDVDPRWQLVGQLLEYKKIKEAANSLEDLISQRQSFLDRYVNDKDFSEDSRPLKNSDKMEIWTSFNLALRNLAEKLVEGKIVGDSVTVSDRMEFILSRYSAGKKFTFSSLFENGKTGIQALVATFLAVLELTRLRRLKLEQSRAFDEIHCEFLDEEPAQTEKVYEFSDENENAEENADEGSEENAEVASDEAQ